MSYQTVNNITGIDGQSGPYNEKDVKNSSIRYGRNAVANYKQYLDDLKLPTNLGELPPDLGKLPDLGNLQKDVVDLKSGKVIPESLERLDEWCNQQNKQSDKTPAVKFKLKYLPGLYVVPQQLNKLALLGASFEDLGRKLSVPVKEMTAKLQEVFGQRVTAEAFDINNDGKIDIAENAAAILVKDMADKIPTDEVTKTGRLDLQADKLDGTYTQTGETNFWTLLRANAVNQSKQLLTAIYNGFQLDKAKNEFESKS